LTFIIYIYNLLEHNDIIDVADRSFICLPFCKKSDLIYEFYEYDAVLPDCNASYTSVYTISEKDFEFQKTFQDTVFEIINVLKASRYKTGS
jgi:hypothetical protein